MKENKSLLKVLLGILVVLISFLGILLGGDFGFDFGIFCRKGNIDIECDGEKYHILPDALSRDRERNNQLTSFGWHVLRFSGIEIYKNLNNCLSTVERTICVLKGLKG